MTTIENKEEPLFASIRDIVLRSRTRVYRFANTALLATYWEIGKRIVEHDQGGRGRAQYGKNLLRSLAQQLSGEFGKGFDESNLRSMRILYQLFPIQDALRPELSWTHYRILIRIENEKKRLFYMNEAVASGWNSRALTRQVTSLAYERYLRKKPVNGETPTINEFIKDPYIFEFLGLVADTKNNERTIETAIIDHLQKFLLEFGKGFAFVARQQHIGTDTSDFYIDIVFYNYLLKCFVIIDLKTGPLTHQDIGQMDMYVRMYDDLRRGEGDNPTIGILLCSEKDETIVKYSVLAENKNLFASKYLLYLPKEEELKELIERDRERWELEEEQRKYERTYPVLKRS